MDAAGFDAALKERLRPIVIEIIQEELDKLRRQQGEPDGNLSRCSQIPTRHGFPGTWNSTDASAGFALVGGSSGPMD